LREELDNVNRARAEMQESMDKMHGEQGGVVQELEELRKTLEKEREDGAHYQKVAQDNQKYMQEYKNQLHSQRDRSAKLDAALQEANAKIDELESTTFIKQLQKEISGAWKGIIEYWMNMRNKGKSEDDEEF
jgi:chromosome segregation ATPase